GRGEQALLVVLDALEVVHTQLGCGGDQLLDPFGAVGRRPYAGQEVRVLVADNAVVGRDDVVLGRVIGVGHLVEGDVPGPVVVAACAVGGGRAVAGFADRHFARGL